MSVTLPITLTPVPVPVGIRATDINQLITILTQYVAASVNTDVSFFQTVSADPTQFTTQIIFNTSQLTFKYWSTSLGKYTAITPFQPGDIKNTFLSGDSPQTGWIECDGRAISQVPNISQNQQGILNSLFGVGGNLPDLTPIQSFNGLPAADSFSVISVATTVPPQNQIANLPFASEYNPVESQNLAANTETLRGSQDSLRTSLTDIQTVSSQLLTALTTPGQPLVACVFVGFP
jgi:hypothetical protein